VSRMTPTGPVGMFPVGFNPAAVQVCSILKKKSLIVEKRVDFLFVNKNSVA